MKYFNVKNMKRIVVLTTILFLLISCSSVGKVKKHKSPSKHYKKTYKKPRKKRAKINSQKRYYKPKALDKVIEKYWGTPYRFGGMSRRGFDCSGFIKTIFYEVYKIKLPRSSKIQYKTGYYVSKRNLKYGDLIFFNTSGRGVSHVGVYIGNNKFAHASSSKGVTVSNLSNVYYKKRYYGARRVLK